MSTETEKQFEIEKCNVCKERENVPGSFTEAHKLKCYSKWLEARLQADHDKFNKIRSLIDNSVPFEAPVILQKIYDISKK